jgi:hypothetical protein
MITSLQDEISIWELRDMKQETSVQHLVIIIHLYKKTEDLSITIINIIIKSRDASHFHQVQMFTQELLMNSHKTSDVDKVYSRRPPPIPNSRKMTCKISNV